MSSRLLNRILRPLNAGRRTDLVAKVSTHMLTLMAILCFFSTSSRAANITLTGTFTADDNVQLFSIFVAAPSTVDIRNYGYGGGTTSNGTVVPKGGFDNILTLFTASGTYISYNDDGAGAVVDPATGFVGDSRITANLAAGSYLVALTQYDNFSLGDLADGFTESGAGNFTANPRFGSGGPCPSGAFKDVSGTAGRCRTGDWTIEFSNVTSVTSVAAVPEPSTVVLLSVGVALLLLGSWRRKNAAVVGMGVAAAFAALPAQAQTDNCPTVSGPDYCRVSDFLNGQRSLLKVTDLQYAVVNAGSPNSDQISTITTSNSGQTLQPTRTVGGTIDGSRRLLMFSANMFNQAPAVTIQTWSGWNRTGTLHLGIWGVQNVDAGPWQPVATSDDPIVNGGAVADFNLDGYDDLALTFGDGRLLVVTPKDVNDYTKGPRTNITQLENFSAIAAGDFDGKGRPEIAGLTRLPNGGLKLVVYRIDPVTLSAELASSLVLTTKNASQINPILRVSMDVGRFNGAGRDQLVVAFATQLGSATVEVVDFQTNSLTPVEGPAWIPAQGITFPEGFLEVKTGKFGLPNNPNHQIVYHNSSTQSGGRFFMTANVDPVTLQIKGTTPVSYESAPGSFGIQIGNFDHRQGSQPDLNDQIAFLYFISSGPDFVRPIMNVYSADPATSTIQGSSPTQLIFPDSFLQLSNHGFPPLAFVATDTQGRSLRLGEPTKITIEGSAQPSVVVGAPPMHVDFISPDPLGGAPPQVFNVSVVPDAFVSTYQQKTSTGSTSSTTNGTSWSFGAKESVTAGFQIGDPDVEGLKGSDTFTAAQTLKGSHDHEHGTFQGQSFDLSASTGFGDEVTYVSNQFNIWVYPVIGKSVCPAGKTCPPDQQVPLTLQFSAPNDDASPEATEGRGIQWYQPPWEPGNIFSYPANLDQLVRQYPKLTTLAKGTGFLTDGVTLSQKTTWTVTSKESDTTGLKQNYSFDNDLSVSGSIGFAGITAQGGYNIDVNGSAGLSSLVKSTTTLGESTGLEIDKPGVFPDPSNYSYAITPYIMGTTQPGGLVDNQPLSSDVQTFGAMRAMFTANPLNLSPQAGGWWRQAYTQAPDVALNHPARWQYSPVPLTANPPGNCLPTGKNTMNCATLNTHSPKNPWGSSAQHMRGFFITSAVSPGQGPQLEETSVNKPVTLQARVYNYSLAEMQNGTEVHVRFYFMPWNTFTNAPSGDSVLIGEQTLNSNIPAFNDSTSTGAHSNWLLSTTTFDPAKYDQTKAGNASVVFWVLVWMQKLDAQGNPTLVKEMPGHGLTAVPGTLKSLADVPEECQTDGNCYSNNVGLFKQIFFIDGASLPPGTLTSGPATGAASINLGKLEASSNQLTVSDEIMLSTKLSATGGAASSVNVNFYDGDPDKGGRLFAVERIPRIAASGQHKVETTFESNKCGVHQIFAVINRKQGAEIVRRAAPVRVVCNGPR